MIKTDTYLICNSTLVQKLKTIKQFNLDLGQALSTQSQSGGKNFIPYDINIQKYFQFFDKIIQKCGQIGTFKIYNLNEVDMNTIIICNEQIKTIYNIDENLSLYDNINISLKDFFIKNGLMNTENLNIVKPKEKEEYIATDKKLSELSIEERILYARNMK
jgi:hypothetical protein